MTKFRSDETSVVTPAKVGVNGWRGIMAACDCQLIGRWRIVQADLWDRDYLDLVEPAYISFGKNGRGEFAFGAVNATLELGYGQRIVFFNWTGVDEGDEICGSGSAA